MAIVPVGFSMSLSIIPVLTQHECDTLQDSYSLSLYDFQGLTAENGIQLLWRDLVNRESGYHLHCSRFKRKLIFTKFTLESKKKTMYRHGT